MKNILLSLFCITASVPLIFAASPAATQEWVRQYIATNVVQSSSSTDFSTNTVAGIMNNIRLQMTLASITTNAVTNATNGVAQ